MAVTVGLSLVGYGIVLGTLFGIVPAAVFPDLSVGQVNRLADIIALVNAAALTALVLGWRWIRQGAVDKHRTAMLTAFTLILLFLALYVTKIGGGGTKEFVGPAPAFHAYAAMLAVHVLLSVASVPLVLHQLVTGLTHDVAELRDRTRHRRIGRIAAAAWIVSLVLGIVTYLLLNHVYGWRFVETALGSGP